MAGVYITTPRRMRRRETTYIIQIEYYTQVKEKQSVTIFWLQAERHANERRRRRRRRTLFLQCVTAIEV